MKKYKSKKGNRENNNNGLVLQLLTPTEKKLHWLCYHKKLLLLVQGQGNMRTWVFATDKQRTILLRYTPSTGAYTDVITNVKGIRSRLGLVEYVESIRDGLYERLGLAKWWLPRPKPPAYDPRVEPGDEAQAIVEALAGQGLQLRINATRSGRGTVTQHWMIETAKGERVLEYWPSSGTWWSRVTKQRGKFAVADAVVAKAVEMVAKLRPRR